MHELHIFKCILMLFHNFIHIKRQEEEAVKKKKTGLHFASSEAKPKNIAFDRTLIGFSRQGQINGRSTVAFLLGCLKEKNEKLHGESAVWSDPTPVGSSTV